VTSSLKPSSEPSTANSQGKIVRTEQSCSARKTTDRHRSSLLSLILDQIAASETYRASASRVWLALAAVYLIWGSTYLAIRFTVETIPPFISAAGRFIFSGAFLVFFRRLAGDAKPSFVQWRSAAIIGIFLLVCGNGGVVWAAQFIPSSLSAL